MIQKIPTRESNTTLPKLIINYETNGYIRGFKIMAFDLKPYCSIFMD